MAKTIRILFLFHGKNYIFANLKKGRDNCLRTKLRWAKAKMVLKIMAR